MLPRESSPDWATAVQRLVGVLAASQTVREPERLLERILARELEDSTSVGHGVSIPHARTRQVDRVCLAVMSLTAPIPTAADDPRPVDILFLLVGPESDPAAMLRVLARLARLVKHESLLADLRAAASPAQMLAVLAEHDARHAAAGRAFGSEVPPSP
jgi:mannitol/fructose-specific phosphotransferase system IIA component (Ntr-type)